MEGRLETFVALVIASALFVSGCDRPKTTPDPRPDADVAKPAPKAMPGVPLDDWVNKAEAIRDRSFTEPPGISPVTEPRTRVAPDAVRADRKAILYGLFGVDEAWDPATPPELEIAWWDGGEKLVKLRTDLEVAPEVRERAVILALLRGLDDEHGPEASAPTSWDAWLAAESLRLGPAYFGLTHIEAQRVRDDITLETVATYPGVVAELPIVDAMFAPEASLEERAATFAPRQGHGLAAAMFRASGWSGVEMLWHDRPDSTAWIVRPDRWLSGDGIGTWEWPKIPTQIRQKEGWELEREGRVGPAITALFLSTVVAPAQARTVYVTWQSDSYRAWRKGDGWLFEWATTWATPTAAEEFVDVAQKALEKQGRDGRFSVLRRGTTVALLGSNDDKTDLDRHAASVVSMTPKFLPRDAGMIKFVPTPPDVAADAIAEATLKDDVWTDPYTGLSVNVAPLEGWDLRRANELSIRWFARKDGALIQFSTEFPDPLAPAHDSDDWSDYVTEGFKKTVTNLKVVAAERAQHAGRPGWTFEFTGEVEGRPSKIVAKQFVSDPDRGSSTPRIVTISLQAPKGAPEDVLSTFDALVAKAEKPYEPVPEAPDGPTKDALLPRK